MSTIHVQRLVLSALSRRIKLFDFKYAVTSFVRRKLLPRLCKREREEREERKIINTPQAKPNERITDFSANLRRSPLCVTPRQTGGRADRREEGWGIECHSVDVISNIRSTSCRSLLCLRLRLRLDLLE